MENWYIMKKNAYNSFVPNQMQMHGHHDGHDSDGSGEYDRLGYESHQVQGRVRHDNDNVVKVKLFNYSIS